MDRIKFEVNNPSGSVKIFNAEKQVNYINENESGIKINDLFQQLQDLCESLEDSDNALRSLRDMERSVGQTSFGEKYSQFIQDVANHITVFAPFIPYLTQLLPK